MATASSLARRRPTVELCMRSFDLSEKIITTPITEAHYKELSGLSWEVEELAPHLNIEKSVLKDILRDNAEEQSRKSCLLSKWKENKGTDATYRELIKAMLKAFEDTDVVQHLCKSLYQSTHTVLGGPSTATGNKVDISTNTMPPVESVTYVKPMKLKFFNPRSETAAEDERRSTKVGLLAVLQPLHQDVHDDLLHQLRRNVEQLMRHYANFAFHSCMSVKDKDVELENFRSFLLNLPAFKSPSSSISDSSMCCNLLADVSEDMVSKDAINEIFDFLSIYSCSFLQYDVFKAMVLEFGDEEDRDRLEEYSQRVQDYLHMHRVFEFGEINPRLKRLKGTMELVLYVGKEVLPQRVSRLFEIRDAVADTLGLVSSAIYLYSVGEESVKLTYLIPVSVANIVLAKGTKFTEKQIADFKALSINSIHCGDFSFDFESTNVDVDMDTEDVKRATTSSLDNVADTTGH